MGILKVEIVKQHEQLVNRMLNMLGTHGITIDKQREKWLLIQREYTILVDKDKLSPHTSAEQLKVELQKINADLLAMHEESKRTQEALRQSDIQLEETKQWVSTMENRNAALAKGISEFSDNIADLEIKTTEFQKTSQLRREELLGDLEELKATKPKTNVAKIDVGTLNAEQELQAAIVDLENTKEEAITVKKQLKESQMILETSYDYLTRVLKGDLKKEEDIPVAIEAPIYQSRSASVTNVSRHSQGDTQSKNLTIPVEQLETRLGM